MLMYKGVSNGAKIVDTAVNVSESARLAPEIYAITFDARPLGEQPTKMIPAAISGGKPDAMAKLTPTAGIIENWHTSPTKTPFGIFATRTKSDTLIEVPIANMINISSGIIRDLNSKEPTLKNKEG